MTKKESFLRQEKKQRRSNRVRAKVAGQETKPRLAVFRSLKHVSAQLIDDSKGKTIAQASDREVKAKAKGIALASEVGKLIGERAVEKGIKQAVFDRRHYRFHGQVKALAEAARQAGLEF